MFRLPMLFIATGMVGFFLYHGLSLGVLGVWMAEPLRSPDGWFRVHLLVLDWATMIAMGAVYQLMDVVLQRRIYSMKLGYAHYAVFTVGTGLLLAGFAFSATVMLATGAVLACVGAGLFVWNVGKTLQLANQWNAVTISTACALGYLMLTAIIGVVMGLNFAFPVWLEGHDRLLAAHIWLGLIGWFGMLITGFSYKMLPMFYLSHGYATRLEPAVIAALHACVLFGAVSFLAGGGPTGQAISTTLAALAFALYAFHVAEIRRRRHKKSPGRGVAVTVGAAYTLAAFGAALLAGWLAFPAAFADRPTTAVLVTLYLGGWVSVTILGYLSKIVPFLWWTHKYGPKAGQANVPVMAQMIPDRWVGAALSFVAVSVAVAAVGMYADSRLWIGIGGTALSAGAIFYMGMIANVFRK